MDHLAMTVLTALRVLNPTGVELDLLEQALGAKAPRKPATGACDNCDKSDYKPDNSGRETT